MRIWVDQLQSQNNELAEEDNHTHKAPPYIRKLRLQLSSDTSRDSIEKLNSDWLKKQSDYHPGDIALKFHTLIDQWSRMVFDQHNTNINNGHKQDYLFIILLYAAIIITLFITIV